MPKNTVATFWPRVDRDGPLPEFRPELGPCWLWLGTIGANGYGYFNLNGKGCLAHRLSYEAIVGPVPEGLELDHLCRVPPCVRPSHLEAVTHRENMLRSPHSLARKTHCPRGHPYDEANTYWYDGRRQCNACRKLSNDRLTVRRREARERDR